MIFSGQPSSQIVNEAGRCIVISINVWFVTMRFSEVVLRKFELDAIVVPLLYNGQTITRDNLYGHDATAIHTAATIRTAATYCMLLLYYTSNMQEAHKQHIYQSIIIKVKIN